MRPVILLHSALGRTDGIAEFAALLGDQGCTVDTPDYYGGRTFTTTEEGVAFRDSVGYHQLFARVADLPVTEAVLVGFSLGASFAQRLARPGVRLVALIGSVDRPRPGKPWCGVDVQLHQYAEDPWVGEDAVAGLTAAVEASGAHFERFVTPGVGHLFTEPSLREYDRWLTELTVSRIVGALQ